MTQIIKRNDKLGTTMNDIMEQAVKTNAPVLCTVEGHGDIVVMPASHYADMLDQIQTVSEDVSGDALFDDDGQSKED